jgi:hypothetical protein
MVLAIFLAGTLFGVGTHWRSERVRSAYRIRVLSETLSHARNENAWLRGDIERKRNPHALDAALKRRRAGTFVRDLPVVQVAPLPHVEVPGL